MYAQSDTDAQVVPDSDAECDASTSPVANVWLYLVLLANSHISLEKETNIQCDRIWENPLYGIFAEN